MSLPSSEHLPDNIHDLPPARQRHLRRMPQAASQAEWEILLDSLLNLTGPTLEFFLLALLGAVASGAALYFNEPVLLILALALLPFNAPIFNLALLPASRKLGPALKSLISLIAPVVLSFGAGLVVGGLAPQADPAQLLLDAFNAPYWPNLAAVAGSAAFCSLVLLRQDRLPRLAGAILSYEIFLPLTVAGFGLFSGAAGFWPGALLTALVHLGLAIVAATLTFVLVGFAPKTLSGWALGLIPLALTLVFLIAALLSAGQIVLPWAPQPASPAASATPALTETEKASGLTESAETPLVPTATLQPTASPSPTPRPSATASPTPSLTPTVIVGIVVSERGAVVREEPSTSALIVTYVYDGDAVSLIGEYLNGNSLWYQVQTATGEIGWMLGSLLETPVPTPTAE
jgi:hypothetical protein